MIRINKNADTAIIVIHEIYGINEHMKNVCQSLATYNFDVICPDLLESEITFNYHQEEIAYHNFMENIGFSKALHKMKTLLLEIKDDYQQVFIVGFSIGATIAWLCSEENGIDGVVGYYGSRIRDYTALSPKCPVMLFFPQEEKSFNVEELISALAHENIEIHKYAGEHGFADPYSLKYNQASAEKAFEELLKFLAN